jgi:hypothetical protein
MQSKFWVRGLTGVVLGAVLSWPAGAATISGTITRAGKPVYKAQLILSCPDLATPALTHTDEHGAYKFSVSAKGSCRLSFRSGTVSAEANVILDPDSTQYDFEVDTTKGGVSLVRRQGPAP